MTTLAEQMLTDALAAQKFTRKYFVTELDFSERSMDELERQFDAVRYALRGGVNDENIKHLTKLWGAYLGETLKRLGGGEWITIQEGDQERVAIQGHQTTIFPHDQICARLKDGKSPNILEFFRATKAQLSQ